MLIIPHSSNVKTGDIIQSYSARNTCPNHCPFNNNGCYADNFHVSMAWDRAENPLDNLYVGSKRELYLALLSATADHARKGLSTVLFRHNVAGDIAHNDSNMINREVLETLTDACNDVSETIGVTLKGYTYTHCSINLQNAKAVIEATSKGFTVNFSCETVKEVIEAKALDCDAVITSVNPEETVKTLKRNGFNALQCLLQTKGISCKYCGLCARHRDLVIVFAVHGNNAKKARTVIMLKQASSN